MSFAIRDLAVGQYALGTTLHIYRSATDTVADVLAPGYWLEAQGRLARGDGIWAACADGAAWLWVSESGSEGVRVRGLAQVTEL